MLDGMRCDEKMCSVWLTVQEMIGRLILITTV